MTVGASATILRDSMRALIHRVLPLLLLFASAPAQDARVQCNDCGSKGVHECSQHRGDLLAIEAAVVQCSVATTCRKCEGALAVDCKICSNPAAERGMQKRREVAAAWLAERQKSIGELLLEPEAALFLQTANCDLTFTLEPMTVGRKKIDSHRLMHLYGSRIEALRAEFVEVFELGERGFPEPADDVSPRLGVHMFEDIRDQRVIAPRVTGIGSQGTGVKLMGATLAYSMVKDPRTLRDDADVHRNVAHNVAHLLLSSMLPTVWIGNRSHGWIDEGVAHWFEEQVDGRCSNFCYEEVGLAPGANWKNGKWKVGIRQLAETGKLRKFTELYQLNSDQLDLEAHAHAFAWVDFLITAHGGAKFADLVRRAKRAEPMRDALEAVYGFGPLQFDDRFEPWVKETYPAR